MTVRAILVALAVAAAAGVAAVVFLYTPRDVVVVRVERGTAVDAVAGTVFVRAEIDSEIRTELPGRVVETGIEVGRAVEEGDLLVRLDTGDLELAIRQTELELAAARERAESGSPNRARLANETEALAVLERQTEQGGYPPAELEKRRRELEQLRRLVALEESELARAVASLENTLAGRRRDVDRMSVRAPFAGVIAQGVSFPGDLLGAGQTVARLVSHARVVEVRVNEESFARVRGGQSLNLRLLGYAGRTFRGTVGRLLPTADPQTQRYTVIAEVDIDPVLLVPGLTGEAAIVIDQREGALLAPRRAVLDGVAVVVREGRARRVPVRLGFVGLNEVEVLEGLGEGDAIVADEPERLRDGERVAAPAAP